MPLGFTEIVLIVLVILLLFGAKRIPEIAKALGRAAHDFKKAKSDIQRETRELLETGEEHAKTEDKNQAHADADAPEKD